MENRTPSTQGEKRGVKFSDLWRCRYFVTDSGYLYKKISDSCADCVGDAASTWFSGDTIIYPVEIVHVAVKYC